MTIGPACSMSTL